MFAIGLLIVCAVVFAMFLCIAYDYDEPDFIKAIIGLSFIIGVIFMFSSIIMFTWRNLP